MSDNDEQQSETKELLNKIGRYNKNIKALMDLMGQVSEKLDKVLNTNTNNENEKEKMDRIFEKKALGRPRGDHNSKRLQYFEMVKSKKIKEPKPATLEYYKINYDKFSDTYTLLDIEN